MDLGNLPTDNLYKFVALTGVVVILFSLYFFLKQKESFERRLEALELETSLLTIDTERLNAEIALFEKAPTPSLQEIQKLSELGYELKRRATRQTGNIKRTERLLRRLGVLKVLVVVGPLIGLLLAYSGFYLWYWRLQRYEDRAVQVLPH